MNGSREAVMDELAATRKVLDVLIEAMRRKFCELKRFSFYHSQAEGVKRMEERGGAWVRWDEVHALFDVVACDALFGPECPSGKERVQKMMLNAEADISEVKVNDEPIKPMPLALNIGEPEAGWVRASIQQLRQAHEVACDMALHSMQHGDRVSADQYRQQATVVFDEVKRRLGA